MIEKDLFTAALLFLAGLSLGGAYFGGLWITLKHFSQWHRPFLTLGLSLVGRLAMLLAAGIGVVQWAISPPLQAILLMGLGFWLGRTLLMTRLLKMA